MRSTRADEALPGMTDTGPRRSGPVYRGVCQTVAAHVDAGRLDAALDAGTIALARSLAHQLDLAGGHGGIKREPYAVAALARELRSLLELLAGGAGDDAPPWLDDDDDDDAGAV
jgi:hypothetical protein